MRLAPLIYADDQHFAQRVVSAGADVCQAGGMNYAPTRREGVPLVPSPDVVRDRSVTSLVRAGIAIARNVGRPPEEAERLVTRAWTDAAAAYLVRAASSPATLATTTALTRTIVADFLAALGPASAGVQLLEKGLQLSFNGAAAINLPSFVADQNAVAFVQEGAGIPVRQFAITTPAPQLVPRKLALITSLTNEMLASSNAEAFVKDVMLRNCALGLDKVLFDATAGDAVRPAGLRYNIAASTASNNADFFEAMVEDVGTLLAAVSQVGSNIVLIASHARAILTRLRAYDAESLPPVLGSAAINAADLIAVAVDALASVTDAAPSIEASREAASVHMDSTPSEIVSSPGVVAYPVASIFQTDRVALKLRFGADWVLRDSRAVAWLTTRW